MHLCIFRDPNDPWGSAESSPGNADLERLEDKTQTKPNSYHPAGPQPLTSRSDIIPSPNRNTSPAYLLYHTELALFPLHAAFAVFFFQVTAMEMIGLQPVTFHADSRQIFFRSISRREASERFHVASSEAGQ